MKNTDRNKLETTRKQIKNHTKNTDRNKTLESVKQAIITLIEIALERS